MKDKLEEFRRQLDKVDMQIVKLLADRMRIVKKIGIYKYSEGIPPLDMKRWQQVLMTRTRTAAELGLNPALVREIYESVHEYAIKLESLEDDK